MFLKQVSVFHCPKNELGDVEFLREALQGARFNGFHGATELSTKGFCPPVADSEDLVLKRRHVTRFQLREESKIIPSQVINDALEERIEEIRESQGRNVGRKERKDLKDEVLFELSQQAFIRRRLVDFYYDENEKLLYVGLGNINKAAEALEFLRVALEGLRALPLNTKRDPVSVYTQWIIDAAAEEPFDLGDNCVLRGIGDDDDSIVRVNKCALEAKDIQEHINNNRVVKEIGLVHDERTSFTVGDGFSLKRLKFIDVEEDEKDDDLDPVAAALVEQELLIGALSGLYKDLIGVMEGLVE